MYEVLKEEVKLMPEGQLRARAVALRMELKDAERMELDHEASRAGAKLKIFEDELSYRETAWLERQRQAEDREWHEGRV